LTEAGVVGMTNLALRIVIAAGLQKMREVIGCFENLDQCEIYLPVDDGTPYVRN
jgi:hypothetical protein